MTHQNMVKTLITGATGFLGTHVSKLFSNAVLLSSKHCDLRDIDTTKAIFKYYSPDIVIHLAAVAGGIGLNQEQPATMIHDNVLINLSVFEACREINVKKLVTVGSVCAYPKLCPIPFRECDIWNGKPEDTNHPYGESKRLLMLMCDSYREQYGLNSIHLIPTNLYGPNDNFDLNTSHVIPAIIRKALDCKKYRLPLQVWGTGKASRDFLYVEDAARAIAKAVEVDSELPINLGSGEEVTIWDLVPMICDIVGFDGEVQWLIDAPDGQPRRCLDTSRAKDIFNWQATTELREGLEKTVRWYESKIKNN